MTRDLVSAPRQSVAGADGALSASSIAAAAQLSCLLEASAPKPGNVSPGMPFADTSYEDFLASAAAIGAPLAAAGEVPLGVTIRRAIESTRQWTRSNTNLGIVLLLAPLARAAAVCPTPPGGTASVVPPAELRQSLRQVLSAATVNDTREVYAAIRLAAPGGLGQATAQDVASEPTIALQDAMRLAEDRDGIAREYVTAFETTFERGAPALERARRDGLSWNDAIVEVFLTVLALAPDTHIVRRAGANAASRATASARSALDAGGVRTKGGRRVIDDMNARLRDAGNTSNPGTTADLTAAALFVVLLGGGWARAAGVRP